MFHLVVATHNPHKTSEFAAALAPLVTISDLTGQPDFPPVVETGRTFEENAILKAEAASRFLPNLVISDDSGLEAVALGGAPGVRSARYASESATDEENVAKLLQELRAADPNGRMRGARFCCVLALARGGKVLERFYGEVKGVIAPEPRGNSGFGYDPVFVPEGYTKTFAELGAVVKDQISHRAQAVAELRRYLDELVRRGPRLN